METYIIERGRYEPADTRLGRHVRHDSRSRAYAVQAAPAHALYAIRHQRYVPVFNQGDIGSCTGQAALGCLGTGPFHATMPLGITWNEQTAVGIYSDATVIDDTTGQYPPEDTGSDGLSVAAILKARGWISGYKHAFGLQAGLTALMHTPVIVGTDWRSGMFNPDRWGNVTPTGTVEGGHEYVWDEYDTKNQRVGFTNSWGMDWGLDGRFYMDVKAFGRLLEENGDATVFTSLVSPAPQPQPVVTGPADRDLLTLAKAVKTWRTTPFPPFGSFAAQDAIDHFLVRKGF